MGLDWLLIDSDAGGLRANVNANYRGKALGGGATLKVHPMEQDPSYIKSYTLIDARLAWESMAVGPGTLELAMWGSNLTDRDSALFARLRDVTLKLYRRASAHAASCGIILADTKFEFGFDGDQLLLIDEALTPDSSRFWPADQYAPGGPQPSFDKQYVRDYLEAIRWNKQPPVPSLPDDVVAKTRDKYLDAFRRLTGRPLR